MLSIPFTPYTWDSAKHRVNSYVLVLVLKDEKSKLIKVSNLSNDIIITIPLKPQTIFREKLEYFTKNDDLRFHEIDVEYENTLILFEIVPQEPNIHFFAYMRYGQRPTSKDYDLNATVSLNENCVWKQSAHGSKEGKTECSFNQPIEAFAKRPGKYFLGVQSYNATVAKSHKREKRACFEFGSKRQKRSCVEVKDPPPTPPQSKSATEVPVYDSKTDQNYTLRVALGSCLYWSEEREMWITDGCQVSETNLESLDNLSNSLYDIYNASKRFRVIIGNFGRKSVVLQYCSSNFAN